jgi:hypothetical protein
LVKPFLSFFILKRTRETRDLTDLRRKRARENRKEAVMSVFAQNPSRGRRRGEKERNSLSLCGEKKK